MRTAASAATASFHAVSTFWKQIEPADDAAKADDFEIGASHVGARLALVAAFQRALVEDRRLGPLERHVEIRAREILDVDADGRIWRSAGLAKRARCRIDARRGRCEPDIGIAGKRQGLTQGQGLRRCVRSKARNGEHERQ